MEAGGARDNIRFDPPELRQQLVSARSALEGFLEWYFYPLDSNYDPDDFEAVVVTTDTEAEDMAPTGAEDETLTVGGILDLADWAVHGSLIDNGTLHRDTQTIFYLETASNRAFHMAYNQLPCSIEDASLSLDVTVGNQECSVRLEQRSMPFAIFVEKNMSCDADYNPPYSDNYIFAIVEHPSGLDTDSAISVCDAFLVELAVSHDLAFTRSTFPQYADVIDPEFEYELEEGTRAEYRLRPLDMSLGMGELYGLYLSGLNATSQAWMFISYVKMLEFVSVTVIKRTVYEEIRGQLMRPEALRPDSRFIDELVDLVGAQRDYWKQKEAIKKTIAECCNLPHLATCAPAFLESVRRVAHDAKNSQAALDDLSEAIVATRNFLVHAKAAYDKTGKECPDDQLSEFVDCLQVIAGQLIVWFGSLPEHARIVG